MSTSNDRAPAAGAGDDVRIRVKAVAVIRRGSDVLLSFARDPDTGERYGRFLGGAIEPGERAADAVRRELKEEIGVELGDVYRLGVVENVYASQARSIHEIIFVFAATLADPSDDERSTFPVQEAVCDGPAVWLPVDRVRGGEIPIYPPELVDLIPDGAPTR